MMREHERHAAEADQLQLPSRAAARHLRRKRLNEARRAEKEIEPIQSRIPQLGISVLPSEAIAISPGNVQSCSVAALSLQEPVKSLKMNENKPNVGGKNREEIKAEREAKRAAKVAAKTKARGTKGQEKDDVNTLPTVTSDKKATKKSGTSENIGTENSKPQITILENANTEDVNPENINTGNTGTVKVKAEDKSTEKVKAEDTKSEKVKAKDTKTEQVENVQTTKVKWKDIKPGTGKPENVPIPTELPEPVKPNKVSTKDSAAENKSEGKSKAEMRAERRAKQEAQRAAKQLQSSDKTKIKPKPKTKEAERAPVVTAPADPDRKATATKKVVPKEQTHEVNLFKHLYHERELAFVDVPSVNSNIHPAVVRLGVQYASKVIVGSNARCVALLAAVKQMIQDFERPSQADFIRGLEASLQESVAYLHHCRPLAVSMQNALRHLKWQMTQLPSSLSDVDAKGKLGSSIDTYISEQVELADKAISLTIQTKISNGNVILTYGYSSLIHKILLDAHTAGKKFRVIVVDGRPWLEGKEQLRRLAKHGIEGSYILINALSFVMPEVSKVFLGAHAILANGAVMSRVGTAQVALMARAFNVPVLVACETHKSCERVQTDSIVYNELGNADDLVPDHGPGTKSLLANWRTKKSLNLLNITYDVTPADLVTAVVTELAILPCTSVPVILRIKPSEI